MFSVTHAYTGDRIGRMYATQAAAEHAALTVYKRMRAIGVGIATVISWHDGERRVELARIIAGLITTPDECTMH